MRTGDYTGVRFFFALLGPKIRGTTQRLVSRTGAGGKELSGHWKSVIGVTLPLALWWLPITAAIENSAQLLCEWSALSRFSR